MDITKRDNSSFNLFFSKLSSSGSPLAKNFPGKSVVSIEATCASFSWGRVRRSRVRRCKGYVHSGFGGAPKTAAKLLWEARRISRLVSRRRKDGWAENKFSPLPVLYGEMLQLPLAVSLQTRIASRL